MAFLKGQKDTITLETVATWDEDLGKTGTDKFKTTWRTMKVSEKERIQKSAVSGEWDSIAEIRERLIGWSGLQDKESGEDVLFGAEVLEDMLDRQAYRDALGENLKTLILGRKAVDEKN